MSALIAEQGKNERGISEDRDRFWLIRPPVLGDRDPASPDALLDDALRNCRYLGQQFDLMDSFRRIYGRDPK